MLRCPLRKKCGADIPSRESVKRFVARKEAGLPFYVRGVVLRAQRQRSRALASSRRRFVFFLFLSAAAGQPSRRAEPLKSGHVFPPRSVARADEQPIHRRRRIGLCSSRCSFPAPCSVPPLSAGDIVILRATSSSCVLRSVHG